MRTKLKMRTKVTKRVAHHGVQQNAGRNVSEGTTGSRKPRKVAIPVKSKPKKRKLLVGLCEQCKRRQKPRHERYEKVTRADMVMLNAATQGHLNCMEVCLAAGASVNQLVPVPRSTIAVSSLMRASKNGHQECASLLIESGADVNLTGVNGSTALYYAASAGRHNCVDLLLKAGADVNISTTYHSLPLNAAVRSSKFSAECVNALIEAGASVNRIGKDGDTALITLVCRGQTAFIEKLIEAGTDVNIPDESDNTPLMRALSASNVSSLWVKSLIDMGADVNKRNIVKETALILAVKNGSEAHVRSLLKAGAEANAETSSLRTALHYTAELGKIKFTNILLKAGADVNVRDSDGKTALMLALQGDYTNIVRVLIRAGTDVDSYNTTGDTSLILAANKGQQKSLELLIKAGADVNCHGSCGKTALMASVHNDACVKLLIDAGANVNKRKDDGETALILALAKGSSNCLNVLIQAGADVNISYGGGMTAMSIASFKLWKSAHVSSLISAGADVNVRDVDGKTVLMSAASRGCTDVVQSLIQAGVDVNRWSKRGETAITVAASEGNVSCLEKLIEAGADVNSHDCQGKTALMNAVKNEDCMRYLIESGAEVNKQNYDGNTALSLGSSVWRSAHINSLLTAGANVAVLDFSRNTPLHHVIYEKNRFGRHCSEAIQCIKFLLAAGAKINTLNHCYRKALESYFELRKGRVNTPLQTCLSTISDTSSRLDRNSSFPYFCNGSCEAELITLFFAAGETVDDHPVKVSDYLDPPTDICLSHICREAIREHLLRMDPHENLFCRAQLLGLPTALQEYLLYNVTLKDDCEDNKLPDDMITQ